MTATEWYQRNFPKGPEHDERCLNTLEAWERLYNISRTGRARLDGGFRASAGGVEIHCPPGVSLSTFDDAALTRLVIAAHRNCCRVEISCRGNYLIIRIHAREPEGTRFYDRHPDLDDLVQSTMART